MLFDFNLLGLQLYDGVYSKSFMVRGLGWNTEQAKLSLVDVRWRLNNKRNPVWVAVSVCYAQKPVSKVSIQRHLSGISEGSVPRTTFIRVTGTRVP
jgi:hypothetical protein